MEHFAVYNLDRAILNAHFTVAELLLKCVQPRVHDTNRFAFGAKLRGCHKGRNAAKRMAREDELSYVDFCIWGLSTKQLIVSKWQHLS